MGACGSRSIPRRMHKRITDPREHNRPKEVSDQMSATFEQLLAQPCRILDVLPCRVPENCGGQYFAVERHWLAPDNRPRLRQRYADLLLALNCYHEIRVLRDPDGPAVINPAPEDLVRWITAERGAVYVLVPSEDALITLDGDDAYATCYCSSEALLSLIRRLASANGLFVWDPDAAGEGDRT